jgi:Leucine-rich repeat (LRR) protein
MNLFSIRCAHTTPTNAQKLAVLTLDNFLLYFSLNVPIDHWSFLHRLPGLHNLTIKNCGDLLSRSPEIIQALSSLRSLCFSHCEGMISLPDYFGDLTSLQKLTIQSCHGMKSLPQNMDKLTNLKDLYILDCPELEKWYESEENEVELAHIRPKYE